jgi:hypothetical protein
MGNPCLVRISVTMLREHSTFFGFASALVCAVVVGSVSHCSLYLDGGDCYCRHFLLPALLLGVQRGAGAS